MLAQAARRHARALPRHTRPHSSAAAAPAAVGTTPFLNPDYDLSATFLPPLKMAVKVNAHDNGTVPYLVGRAAIQAEIAGNAALVKLDNLFEHHKGMADYESYFKGIGIRKPAVAQRWRQVRCESQTFPCIVGKEKNIPVLSPRTPSAGPNLW